MCGRGRENFWWSGECVEIGKNTNDEARCWTNIDIGRQELEDQMALDTVSQD
ncbi:hypothetical protein GBA52_005443 [Prunus armeniaca]|nr:hypothetical protein GBA52_005443 [Prunus armeniaca]